MKRIRKATLATLAAFALVTTTLAADGPAAARKERVSFARGAMSATIQGTLKGDGDVDYLVRAAAGQTLRIEFRASHGQNNFNVLPPGSTNVAMYSSRDTGERFPRANTHFFGELTVQPGWRRSTVDRWRTHMDRTPVSTRMLIPSPEALATAARTHPRATVLLPDPGRSAAEWHTEGFFKFQECARAPN